MKHRGLQPIIVCSNDDHGVTLTYLTARSNLVRDGPFEFLGGGGAGLFLVRPSFLGYFFFSTG